MEDLSIVHFAEQWRSRSRRRRGKRRRIGESRPGGDSQRRCSRCWWQRRWQNAAADDGVTVVLLFPLMFSHSFYFASFSQFLSSPLNLCFSLLLFFLLPLPSLVLKTLSPQSFPLLYSSLLSIFLLSFSFLLLLSSFSVFFSVLSLSSLSSCSSKRKNMPLGSLYFSSQNVPCFSVLSSLFIAANLPCFSILSSLFIVANYPCFLLDLYLFILVRSLLSLCFFILFIKIPSSLFFVLLLTSFSLFAPSFPPFWFPC